MTNPSTAQARALVEGFLAAGVDEFVLAPGSRNGPLAIALAQADAQGALRLHVRLDERSAAFLALGLARRSGRPAVAICTSGTAVAHFHAAAIEATEAGVPLVLLTADRPAVVRGLGANQTIDQREIFGHGVLRSIDVPVAAGEPQQVWMALAAELVAAALGSDTQDAGAVHGNVQFAEPLVPGEADATWAGRLPAVAHLEEPKAPLPAWSETPFTNAGARGVVIASDPRHAHDVIDFASRLGWPVLAEPGSGARSGPNAISHYPELVADPQLRPDVVVTVGRFALSRSTAAFVRSASQHVVIGHRAWDPLGTASHHLARLPRVPDDVRANSDWLGLWQVRMEQEARVPLSRTRAFIACALQASGTGDLVWYGPSSVIRHAESVAPCVDDAVVSLMNRGTNGIDGVVSSAMGAALAHQRADGGYATALMGDLTFLHDVNGLLIEAGSPVPDLAIVVIDSNGGRIFASLEQGDQRYEDLFDRVYGTPHNRDLVAIATAMGAQSQRVRDNHSLELALAQARIRGGVSVIVVDDQE